VDRCSKISYPTTVPGVLDRLTGVLWVKIAYSCLLSLAHDKVGSFITGAKTTLVLFSPDFSPTHDAYRGFHPIHRPFSKRGTFIMIIPQDTIYFPLLRLPECSIPHYNWSRSLLVPLSSHGMVGVVSSSDVLLQWIYQLCLLTVS